MSGETVAYTPEYIAEIGFGDGHKIKRLALNNPKTVYIGFEVPSNSGTIESVLPNLFFDYSGAIEGLSRFPAESFSSIIMDLVLEDDFTVTQWQSFIQAAPVNEVRFSDLPSRKAFHPVVKKIFDSSRKEFLIATRRSLKDDGELCIHTFKQDLNRVETYLTNTGFIFKHKKSTPEETSQSKYMKGISEKVEQGDDYFISGGTIYTIIAKKDLTQKETKLLSL
jgi:hypothetical protein